jgi:tRNA pseudouridine38-40 synthase
VRNIALTIAYDGTEFAGWQTQPEQRTAQETLEKAIAEFTAVERVLLVASGRTDAGVHAIGQVANFTTAAAYPLDVVIKAINARMPGDIVVTDAKDMPPGFNANKDAKRKLYRFVIHDGPVMSPFMRRYAVHNKQRLDAAAMRRASECLKGRHDFHSFETEWPNRQSSVRTITHLGVSRAGDYIWIDVEADGFLYNMVRSIAGSLMDVGRGYIPESRVAEILNAEDRREAGPTAPPHGLFLMRVTYD